MPRLVAAKARGSLHGFVSVKTSVSSSLTAAYGLNDFLFYV